MECMREQTGLISSYQLLITAACTNTGGKMKGSHPEQLTGAHLYLDIAKSGYLLHAVGNVMGPSQGNYFIDYCRRVVAIMKISLCVDLIG